MKTTATTEAVSSPPEEKWHLSQQWRQNTFRAGQKPRSDWKNDLQTYEEGRKSRKPPTPFVGIKPYGKSQLKLPTLTRRNMNTSKKLKARVQTIFAALIAAVSIGGLASTLWSAEPVAVPPPPNTNSAPANTNSVAPKVEPPVAKKTAVKKKLSGAELYSMHCNRCHAERYPTERTAAQWKTIMLHMQVRANLPAAQARLILKYLQENSGR